MEVMETLPKSLYSRNQGFTLYMQKNLKDEGDGSVQIVVLQRINVREEEEIERPWFIA